MNISTSTGIVFHTGAIFNNGGNGIDMTGSTGNYYYGTIQIFDNATGNTFTNASRYTGSATDSNISGLGRSTGNLNATTSYLFCNFAIVDIFVGQSEPYCSTVGYLGISTQLGRRKYGEQAPLQRQPVLYTTSGLQLTGTSTGLYAYNTNLFIGDYPFAGRVRLSGGAYYASGVTGYTNTTTGLLRLYSNQAAIYTVTGNITS